MEHVLKIFSVVYFPATCSSVCCRSLSTNRFSGSLSSKATGFFHLVAKATSLTIRTTKLRLMPPSSSTKIVAEYAKSNRSLCKKCSKAISARTLRMGFVSRDARGFDMTRWHHFDCFPTDSGVVLSAEKIIGFASLKKEDQDALTKLLQQCNKTSEGRSEKGDIDGERGTIEPKEVSKRKRSNETNEDEVVELDEKSSIKAKLSTSDVENGLETSISASDITDKYRDADLLPNWKAFQSIIFLEGIDGLHGSEKIAAFDFDGCLVKTSVKRVGADAWSLMYPSIPEKLQNLYNHGYKVVIFTNESNIDRWKNKRQVAVDSKIGRLSNFIKLVKIPIQVFVACGYDVSSGKADPYRKPKTGMWHIMAKQFNSGITIDMDQSFYVGDAAGRPNDHSDADMKFALALGLKFYVPEEYFSC